MNAADWACALAAPIRARLRLPLEGLAGGHQPTHGRGSRFCRDQLRNVASIRDRADLEKQLPSYIEGGSRAEYERYRGWHAALPPEARTAGFWLLDQTERLKRIFVHDHAGRPEEVSLAAWDVGRIVHYAGLGYGAAYLDEAEAWQYVAKAARIALATYDSWEGYARGYLYGRWFWQGYWEDGMKETQQVIDVLLGEGGAYRTLAWHVDVTELEALGARPAMPAEPAAFECLAIRAAVACPACLTPTLMRTPTLDARCDACGERSEVAARHLWAFALTDEEDDDDDDEEPRAEGAAPGLVELYTNLGDELHTVLKRTSATATCADCSAAIASSALAEGDVTCKCGAMVPVVPATAWMRAICPRIRFVVGGPLTLGRHDAFLQFILEKKSAT